LFGFPVYDCFENFDDFPAESTGEGGDDVNDFLKREQEFLGEQAGFDNPPADQEDFNQDFGSSEKFDEGFENNDFGGDNNQFSENAPEEAFEQNEENDFGKQDIQDNQFEDKNTFEDFSHQDQGFGSNTGSAQRSPQTQYQTNDPYRAVGQLDQTSQAIIDWKAKQEGILKEKDTKSDEKNKKALEEAKGALEDFYNEYNVKKQERKKKNRNEQEAMTEGKTDGTVWEKINELVDLSQKAQKSTRDVSKFRSILTQLKSDKNAPGA